TADARPDRGEGALGPRRDRRRRDGRAAVPARRPGRRDPFWWRAPARGSLPAPPLQARPAPSRRADQPSRCRLGRMARPASRRVSALRRRGHAPPLFPRLPTGRDARPLREAWLPRGPRLRWVVVAAEGNRRADADKLVFDDLSVSLPRGGIVGVIGPNGAGKTTLFRLITGGAKVDGGTLRVGDTVKLAYVSQTRDTLDPTKSVWEEISGGEENIQIGARTRNARAYAASLNFRGADQQKKVGDLSGGERNRVHLAKLLRSGGNVLLLDEPTNDLDVDTLRALEEALLDFAGCVAVISHDRWFLDRVATHMLVFEGDSSVRWFEGNYRSYEEHMRSTIGADWRPHRIRYRPLTRA